MFPALFAMLLMMRRDCCKKESRNTECFNYENSVRYELIPFYSDTIANGKAASHHNVRVPKYYIRIYEKEDKNVPLQYGKLVIRGVPKK